MNHAIENVRNYKMKVEVKLTQDDLSTAVKSYLRSNGVDTVGKKIDLSVSRGGTGATVELSDEAKVDYVEPNTPSITPHH